MTPAALEDNRASDRHGRAPSAPMDDRRSVATFDVFDTLIARRCIEPRAIFEMIAAQAKIENFAAARIEAEARVAGQPHDLDTIYATLGTILPLDKAQLAALKTLEIRLEQENVIPIAETMAEVADGDVLISDMYLGADVIRTLLDAAGLQKKSALIVTTNGKQSGRLWPELLKKFHVTAHVGDNVHSDVAMPRSFGIVSQQTTLARPNAVEQTLLDIGLRDLATICRETRLASWSERPNVRALQIIQADFNFPILVLASVALSRFAERENLSSLLFCSRDCNLWLPLFRIVARDFGLHCKADYFYTSRITRTEPSDDYLSYAKDCIAEGAAIVDLCGTGWSLSHLAHNLCAGKQMLFFLHRLPQVALYEQHAPTPATCEIMGLLEDGDPKFNHMALEMSNYAAHPMVVDIRRIENATIPIFASDERPDDIRHAIEAQRRCFLSAVTSLEKHGLRETLALDDASLKTLCAALYQGLSNQNVLKNVYGVQHYAEDIATLKQLGCI
jgi:hypothetical protein